MRKSLLRLAILPAVLLTQAVTACAAKPKPLFSPQLHYQPLVAPPSARRYSRSFVSLSPNRRWLAYFHANPPKNREQMVFHDLQNSRTRIFDAGRIAPDAPDDYYLFWRQDSGACAVGSAAGWRVVWPEAQRSRRLTSKAPGFESIAAWSPDTGRLALFEGGLYGSGLYRLWDGKRLSKGIVWHKAVKYPYGGEERAWQCEWSPDEKSILFRFYGHAERSSESAGHTIILNPRTARPRYRWGTEAGPAFWLDKSRIMYEYDRYGSGPAPGLFVATPAARRERNWLPHTLAWTLSPRRDTAWALTEEGKLYRTSTRRRNWQLIRRHTPAPKKLGTMFPALHLSPRGDMIAIYDNWGEKSLTLFSTSRTRPWTLAWRPPSGTIKLIGWPPAQTLPLLEWQQKENAPGVLIQLTK